MLPSRSSTELAADQHIAGAEAHLAFGDSLRAAAGADPGAVEDPTVVGWAITALFYCAVHAVRAYLVAAKGVRVSAHEDMKRYLADYPELRKTSSAYSTLKQESESARYYLNSNFRWKDYDELRKDAARVLATWKPKVVESRTK